MKKKILIVLTGGTICASIRNGLRTLDGNYNNIQLVDNFRHSNSCFANSVEFELGKNFNVFSENMTITIWNEMITYFQTIDFAYFDGIIVAHGTDTLAYTSSLFSFLLAGIDKPVFFVSSNAPLELGNIYANGNENFRAAVECICHGIQANTYVTYKNINNGKTYLHLGSRLTQCRNYSEDFYSVGAIDISNLGQTEVKLINSKISIINKANSKPLLYTLGQISLSDCILKINPYVGLNYDGYHYSKYRAVLHGSYHSGTVCVECCKEQTEYSHNSILYLIDKCVESGVAVYVAPVLQEGDIYDTIPIMMNHKYNEKGITALYGTTNEMAYIKLLIMYSCDCFRNQLEKLLYLDCCGEYMF